MANMSSTESDEPSRKNPTTDMEDPKRDMLRRAIEEAKSAFPNNDMDAPMRLKLRKESEEPM
jgi:hypothetical protein